MGVGGTLDALFENQDDELGDNVGFADFAHPFRQKRTRSKDKKIDVIKKSHVVKKMFRMVIKMLASKESRNGFLI